MYSLHHDVLLIEDNPGDVFLIQQLLAPSNASGFRLSCAESLNHARAVLSENHFSVILLDLGLPESHGLQTLYDLQAMVASIPIVVLTGLDDKDLSTQALHNGAQDYLVKGSITRTWLISTLNHSIERSQILQNLQQRELGLTVSNQILEQTVKEQTSQLSHTYQQLHQYETLVNLDPLTNLANRRHFSIRLKRDWHTSMDTHTPLALLMIDLDDFKQFNDAYGHPKGDECLQQVTRVMQSALKRHSDLAVRYGGEEFVALLPNTHYKGAITVAERILNYVRGLSIPHRQSRVSPTVTVSIGIALAQPPFDADSQMLVEEADKALYLSKTSGRDRWSINQLYSIASA